MNYIVVSDIHLGHNTTPTEHIISNLKKYLLTSSNTTVDVIFIAGDLFDQLIDLTTKAFPDILKFLHELLDYCADNKIKLRVLEGTPSHDWQQSKLILKLNEIKNYSVDLKYYSALDIEYLEPYNEYILYIPDEWIKSQKELEDQINQKLSMYNITSVTTAILHGAFNYQLRNVPTGFIYDEHYMLSLVKKFIHIGHYHTHTTYDRIIANGSFDRLAHGEEEPKGYVKVSDSTYTFMPNPNALTYKTIKTSALTTLDQLDKKILKLPPGSHVRVIANKDSPIYASSSIIKGRYSQYTIKILSKEQTSDSKAVTYIVNDDSGDFSIETFTSQNLYLNLKEGIVMTFKDKAQIEYGIETIQGLLED